MMDLTKYTVVEFAKAINEDANTIADLMRNNNHLGYVNNPFEGAVRAVANVNLKEENKEVVAKFIYTNLFNRPEHRFYNGRGYGLELR